MASAADVVPDGGRPASVEFSNLSRSELPSGVFDRTGDAADLGSDAFFAASKPAWRMARFRGVLALPAEDEVDFGGGVENEEADGLMAEGVLEGVLVVEAEGVEVPGRGGMFCLISPNSFHSSTSVESWSIFG